MTFQFESFLDFLQMDGHGPYVWASYIITILVIKTLIIIPSIQRKSLATQIKRQQRIQQSKL
jgi:heme exporter protein D